jgi:hypothetical protein
MFRINSDKLKKKISNLPEVLGEKAFLTFFGLLILSLAIGSAIFFKNDFLAKRTKIENVEKPIQFKEESYWAILDILIKREEKLEAVDSKTYSDPFSGEKEEILVPVEEVESPVFSQGSGTNTLFEFYNANKSKLPPVEERAKVWEQMGLGKAGDYLGTFYQNVKLLQALMED